MNYAYEERGIKEWKKKEVKLVNYRCNSLYDCCYWIVGMAGKIQNGK